MKLLTKVQVSLLGGEVEAERAKTGGVPLLVQL